LTVAIVQKDPDLTLGRAGRSRDSTLQSSGVIDRLL
jgi:hypothetical protein